MFTWARYGVGYEVSSAGDRRFSAFNAVMADRRCIECHYQLDEIGKGWNPGGTDWRLGKGRPPKDPNITREQLWDGYLSLWQTWAFAHPDLMEELRSILSQSRYRGTLLDRFASTAINQAHALAELLNRFPSFYDFDE